MILLRNHLSTQSDDLLRGTVQKFDFDTEDEEEPPLSKQRKSKQSERPSKIIPTASDASDDSDEDSEDENGRVTMANMEARSRALDAKAAAEAELDEEELREAAASDEEDIDGESDAEGEIDAEPFHLPTASEREVEKQSGGPDVHVIQRRMRECARVLGKFKRLAEKNRCVLISNSILLLQSTFLVHGQSIRTNSFLILPIIMATMSFWQKSFSNYFPFTKYTSCSSRFTSYLTLL